MIRLGSRVRDTITGFSGIATSRAEYLFGCVRVGIQPTTLHDGSPIEDRWFDEQRVEVVEERAPVVSQDSSATSGGPQHDPRRPSPPRRA